MEKFIIDGRTYNPYTSKLVNSWTAQDRYGYPYGSGDWNYYKISLYKKRNGEYFLLQSTAYGETAWPISNDYGHELENFEFKKPEFNGCPQITADDLHDKFSCPWDWEADSSEHVKAVQIV